MKLLTRDISPRTVAAVVAAAFVLSLVGGREKPSERIMTAHAAVQPRPAAEEDGGGELSLERLKRELPPPGTVDPFAPRSFAPPAPKLVDAPPPKPSAPPLPFAYLGKVVDNGKTSVFVARGDENHALEAGQTIGGTYRVEKITDSAVTFTYLPMKTRQTLAIPRSE